MARRKTIKLAALNIKTEPHSPERYVQLWEFLYNTHTVGHLRGNDFLVIDSLEMHDQNAITPLIKGSMAKFTEINIHDPWFNLETRERIETESVEEIVRIPHEYKPNLKQIYYTFNPDRHRLIFEADPIAPSSIKRAFENIMKSPLIRERYGDVAVELEISRDAIQEILSLQNIMSLEIQISRPNPDGISHLERRVYNRMADQNIRRQDFKATTTHPDGILPDEETIAMINASQSNGKTVARAKIGEITEVFTTENQPRVKRYSYDSDFETLSEVVLNNSYDYLSDIE